jgi:hypothetical protein
MAAPPMRTRYDQFGKQMVRTALEVRGPVETDAEVLPDTRRIDLWFLPDASRPQAWECLGYLGRMTVGPSTLELFHGTPSGDELTTCVIKHGEFRHLLTRRMRPAPNPILWVVSAGRPDSGIDGLRFEALSGWPSGFYEGPSLLWTRLVVVNELPEHRDTLLLRLLGSDRAMTRAITELQSLPEESPERSIALPALIRYNLNMPTNPADGDSDDEVLRKASEWAYEVWHRKTLEDGQRKLLLRQLRRRFGSQVDGEMERRLAAASNEQLESWADRVLSAATLADLLAS